MFREYSSFEKCNRRTERGIFSQFFIIGGAGAVESTVVGHLKTVLIVLLGSCKWPQSCHVKRQAHAKTHPLSLLRL